MACREKSLRFLQKVLDRHQSYATLVFRAEVPSRLFEPLTHENLLGDHAHRRGVSMEAVHQLLQQVLEVVVRVVVSGVVISSVCRLMVDDVGGLLRKRRKAVRR